MVPCPCCGYLTLNERGAYEICPVCFWEDDGQGDHDAGLVRGGPNGALSLAEARANFAEFGACDRAHVADVRRLATTSGRARRKRSSRAGARSAKSARTVPPAGIPTKSRLA